MVKVCQKQTEVGKTIWYCCWKKSCTSWDVQNLVNTGVNYLYQLVSRISSISSRSFDRFISSVMFVPKTNFCWGVYDSTRFMKNLIFNSLCDRLDDVGGHIFPLLIHLSVSPRPMMGGGKSFGKGWIMAIWKRNWNHQEQPLCNLHSRKNLTICSHWKWMV